MNDNEADAIVDAAFIAAHLDDPAVRLVEVDVSPVAYTAGHIPGAVLWNAYTDLRHPDFRTISSAELQELLRRSGIAPDTTVVTYGYAAHLGYWLLKSCGHSRVRLMDGSREQWASAGNEWSTDTATPARSDYGPVTQDRLIASRADVSAMIGDPARVILDVRSEAEYVGEQFWPSGAPEATGRAGHIPGAVHLHVDLLLTSEGKFKPADEIRQILADRGIDLSPEIVTYCTIGNRGSQAWFALTNLLGATNARVYYGSWVEWGKAADTEVET